MNKLQVIDFNQIYEILMPLKSCLKISYLTPEDMRKVINFPNKENRSTISGDDIDDIKNKQGIFLIIMQNEDISNLPKKYQPIDKILINKLNSINQLKIQELFYINKKLATVLAGLGQYSRNQLVYNNDYGFSYFIRIFAIHNPIIKLPLRKIPQYGYTEMCANCDECIKNCPAQAIHDEKPFSWVDYDRCRNYCFFGNSDKFFSVKYGINDFLKGKISNQELFKIHNNREFKKIFGFNCEDSFIPNENGEKTLLSFDYCKECMNQLPCRKQECAYNNFSYQVHSDNNMLEI